MKVVTRQVAAVNTTPASPAAAVTTPAPAAVVVESRTESAEVVVAEKHEVTRYTESPQVVGEISQSDIQIPRLQIAQGNGDLTKIHPQGTVLYMDEVLLKTGDPTSFNIIPFHITKRYRERTEKGSKELPRIVNTEREVRELGGTTQWIGSGPSAIPPNWSPTATVHLLIEKPANVDHTGFTFEVDGKFYGAAILFVGNTSYKYVGKQILTASTSVLFENGKQKLHKYVWKMKFQLVKSGAYEVYTPIIARTSVLTPESVSELIGRLSGGSAAVSEFEE